jgi:hypothetical protein
MSQKTKRIGLLVLLLIAGALARVLVQPTRALAPGDPDRDAMEKTISKYLDIKAEAQFSLDDSELDTVLANDPRGGKLEDEKIQAVRFMKNDPDLLEDHIGLLDYYQARYSYYRSAKKIYDDAVSSGRIVVPTPVPYDPSDNPVPLERQGTEFDRRTPQPDYVRLPPESLPEVRAVCKQKLSGELENRRSLR